MAPRRADAAPGTTCRVSVVVILRAAPIATMDELMEPEAVQHHEMFDRCALKPPHGRELSDIPILVDHIKEAEPIGRVTALRTDRCWTGGTWQWVHAEITDPPAWLRKGAAVSISHSAYSTRTPWGAEWDLIQKAFLNEVSILSPGVKPAHPRARVEWIGKPEPQAARTDRRPAGEVIHHPPGGVLVRRNTGQVLAVGGVPLRGTERTPRPVGRTLVIDRDDGSQLIYCDQAEYLADLRAGAVR